MGLLKTLTGLKTNNKVDTSIDSSTNKDVKITYYDEAYSISKSCGGTPHNLDSALHSIYEKFEKKCREDYFEQEKLKQPYIVEIKGKKTSLLNKSEEIKKNENKKSKKEEDIEKLNYDAINVKRQPEIYGIDVEKVSSVKFWIGLTFLLPLTVYIFIFYISTSYSAFFRYFDPETSLFTGMFYPKALSESYESGMLVLGFVLFIPFVFFALGYLIHMFQEKKGMLNNLKIVGLFIITFLFDAILAYLIDEKMYEIHKTIDSPDFNISLAFQSVSFWLIIFAGFVSYIVWGLVFDFVMTEYADRDKIKSFIREKKEEILNIKKSITKIVTQISKIESICNTLKTRITELRNIIDGFILPIKSYKAFSAEYYNGWQNYIGAELPIGINEKKDLQDKCKAIYDNHIKELELDTDNYQNKVYIKTL